MPKKNQIPEMENTKKQMAEVLRHYAENGSSNFKMIALSEVIIPNNLSKKHSKKQISKLVQAIKKVGYANPIIIDERNCLIAGYARILAAKELKMTQEQNLGTYGDVATTLSSAVTHSYAYHTKLL